MTTQPFTLQPNIKIKKDSHSPWVGWDAIGKQLAEAVHLRNQPKTVVTVECYPGVNQDEILQALQKAIQPQHVFQSNDVFLSSEVIGCFLQPILTDDPVFGRMTNLVIQDFLDPSKQQDTAHIIATIDSGIVLVLGPGASLLHPGDLLVYADLPRWEAQLRYRRNESDNLGFHNRQEPASLQYKQAFFVDWRVGDRLKVEIMDRWDYWLDTVHKNSPKMVTGDSIRSAFRQTVAQPFSVVPYFDPAPWGGKWVQEKFGLDSTKPNFGWCFNCVPEENSVLFDFGGVILESPAINLVFYQSVELLGQEVFNRFGAEFPIRFDYLDTMGGGNLSFQVHPTTHYIQKQFGMAYTQDESYYLVDAGDDASVYLGMKTGINPEEMIQSLEAAQNGGPAFDAERFVNRWPAKKHDHFLIPGGTTHCSGQDAMVLEISATPYIFTFKLWDWGRLGLDGKPRPIHIHHGENVIQWDRTTDWVRRELINRFDPVNKGEGWREERTGLHELEFIETRRHWFTSKVPHHTQGTVHVICLVEGSSVVVESPSNAFEPATFHYGEVFIVPAVVGEYAITPAEPNPEKEYATLKAYVRSQS